MKTPLTGYEPLARKLSNDAASGSEGPVKRLMPPETGGSRMIVASDEIAARIGVG
ncbi:MAG TPA: hypothetical protein VFJ18_02670 [Pararhizobium sp.]|jgi:hypothetical protein|nr:hypothetical protein [Pararhizobium sp.]